MKGKRKNHPREDSGVLVLESPLVKQEIVFVSTYLHHVLPQPPRNQHGLCQRRKKRETDREREAFLCALRKDCHGFVDVAFLRLPKIDLDVCMISHQVLKQIP